jgi:hypothetical protein
MASKLRQSSARVSFFAFQDMITTVTGVLIIVMLLLSMEVTHRVEASPDPARKAVQEQLQEARRQLAANLELLHQRQADVGALASRIFVLPEPDPSGKLPVLIAISATNGWLSRLGETNLTGFSLRPSGDGFNAIMASCNPTRDRLVFYVPPSGVEQFYACRKVAKQLGFDVSHDAAEEDRQYVLTR